MTISRRSFLETAAALGASLAWVAPARASHVRWREQRDLYPQGVASGDPDAHSVILWTRRPFAEGARHLLVVEVAEDAAFHRVIAHAQAPVSSASDWTALAQTMGELALESRIPGPSLRDSLFLGSEPSPFKLHRADVAQR